ncbi:MAG TPA: fumarylacetoacetate hydrolase family protein [Solirubrobacteraceae bacterium]|jgi:2-keto-4-pentenoate hydratase/2-oxohepta-3-ene-1,7-dioic acid hydratase in catechol pathway|nr:fumarylacetoacetate hydrolase family protein [Solirubrobacteraceae bacterium]
MIWCRFESEGGARYGIVEDETVVPVEGSPFDGHVAGDERLALGALRLLAPVEPRTFFCAGLNYRAHIEHARARGNLKAQVPEHPEVGYRANNALIGHGEDIVVPGDVAGPVEAEPEVAAVIGRPLRHATREQALAGIFGWTIGNDVSARAWQAADRTFWRAKNCDTFKPMGPWIVTDADPAEATTTTRVNGRNVLSFATGEMIFDAADFIVAITQYITMAPGDVLWMGADGTVPIAPGDTVEISVSGIGTLRNRVVAETQ